MGPNGSRTGHRQVSQSHPGEVTAAGFPALTWRPQHRPMRPTPFRSRRPGPCRLLGRLARWDLHWERCRHALMSVERTSDNLTRNAGYVIKLESADPGAVRTLRAMKLNSSMSASR